MVRTRDNTGKNLGKVVSGSLHYVAQEFLKEG